MDCNNCYFHVWLEMMLIPISILQEVGETAEVAGYYGGELVAILVAISLQGTART
jgi:hypothetical protein